MGHSSPEELRQQIEMLRQVPVDSEAYRRYLMRLSTQEKINAEINGETQEITKLKVDNNDVVIDTGWRINVVPNR